MSSLSGRARWVIVRLDRDEGLCTSSLATELRGRCREEVESVRRIVIPNK